MVDSRMVRWVEGELAVFCGQFFSIQVHAKDAKEYPQRPQKAGTDGPLSMVKVLYKILSSRALRYYFAVFACQYSATYRLALNYKPPTNRPTLTIDLLQLTLSHSFFAGGEDCAGITIPSFFNTRSEMLYFSSVNNKTSPPPII
jgi:hypothetical protein